MIDLLRTQEIKDELETNPQNVEDIINGEKEIGICITDSKGHFKLVNDRYCQIYDYKREDLIGQSFTLVVPEDKRDYMQDLHDKFIKNKTEILRNWTVMGNEGKLLKIQADAGWNDKILDSTPHKITFVHLEEA